MPGWKTDDKAWMKQRRAQWKQVKECLNKLDLSEKGFLKPLKSYYLTGEYPDDKEYPMSRLEYAPLIEIWFDPEQTEENWQQIKSKYADWKWSDAKRRFKEIARELGFAYMTGSEESFFAGLEHRIYRFMFPSGLKRDDHPELTDEQFSDLVFRGIRQTASFDRVFMVDIANPYSLIFLEVEKWHDALLLGYQERGEFTWCVEWVDRILPNPDAYQACKVQLAKEIAAVLENPNLPQVAKDKITEIRARPGHPDCEEE